MWTNLIGCLANSSYALELLAAAFFFLYDCPRRQRWYLRLLPFAAAALLVSCITFSSRDNQLLVFAQLLLIIGVTVTGMSAALEAPFLTVLSGCSAGVALQHIGHHISLLLSYLPGVPAWTALHEVIWTAVLIALLWVSCRRVLWEFTRYPHHNGRITAISVVTVLICTGLTRIARMSQDYDSLLRSSISLYSITCCILALITQYYLHHLARSEMESELFQRLRAEEHKQFDLSRETSEQLHIVYHDLRHKLRSLERQLPADELRSMRNLLDTYGDTYRTGLDTLDVVLNEKIFCGRGKGVQITFLGNGADLAFLDAMELYSMFGNLLDNAITAVEELEQAEQRLVSLVVERRGSFLLISVSNYCRNGVLSFTNGLPDSTKTEAPGFHGYGLRSIRAIARKYDGDLTVRVLEGIFHVCVYMMDNAGKADL